MKREDINTLWAEAFVDELARGGVTDLCVAPGSRSTPIVLAAVRDGRFRMYPIVDERSAGYFALGLGKASGRPAAVVTTSGTAAANLYPSVIEASQGEVPLLVLTADRPHRLRDADGNQAIDQLRLFGTYPRGFFEIEPARPEEASLRHLRALAGRAISLAKGPPMGPVHLNFPFEKPLEPVVRRSPAPALGGQVQVPQVRVAPRYSTLPEAEILRPARDPDRVLPRGHPCGSGAEPRGGRASSSGIGLCHRVPGFGRSPLGSPVLSFRRGPGRGRLRPLPAGPGLQGRPLRRI